MLNQPRRRSPLPLITGFALVAVAAGFLVWSVLGMVSAGSDVDRATQELADAHEKLADLREDDGIATRTARDEAHDAGRDAVVVMNTLDYRTIDDDLEEWARVTTGALHDEIVDGRSQSRQAVVDAKSVTKATVLSSAVKAVDERAGTASVLVALRVNVTTGDDAPADRYIRLQGTLLRTEQGWQLDSIGQVPVTQ